MIKLKGIEWTCAELLSFGDIKSLNLSPGYVGLPTVEVILNDFGDDPAATAAGIASTILGTALSS
ncbi:MAG: hypothetical protein E5Y65_26075 [Mesorhizobium sp.]|uniref:hypothetical protein n=1 Tax=Mesorhizobium sp. TaxID=1871066 RepID=UPI001200548F|nr:hypothetical protein [Mesorhizobium sp.]TIL72273.1 MAG: hypothetical protein E5Y70_22425 [Mesorhizobium sp.]TIL86617.1 MAG: hypothetical protein E5Y65_26075 [Mesorhizobium sp.]TIL98382.1 MAG: hypothetical protein E5Y64_26445 [Mesorhizobium sp.]